MTTYPDSREILTLYGPIIGRRLIYEGERQVDAFQGVPYAKPPLGDLRFKKPVQPDPWKEVKECKKFGPRSIQNDVIPGLLPPTSEDCLSANIFTPVWEPKEKRGFPVMMFIHGGAYVQDSAVPYGDVNICKFMVTKGVIVVTFQYRLGYLGFWSTGDDHCPGNNGLWDIRMALQWVKENISRFNGDPNNISLMGDSAGGVLADMMSLSPHSRDLFQKVICMSGNANLEWSLSYQTVETCRKAAEEAGVNSFLDSEKYLSDLRKLPASSFVTKFAPNALEDETVLGPRLDGYFFPKPLVELRKEAPSKPRIIGLCKSEGLLFMIGGPGKPSDIDKTAALLFSERNFPDFRKLRVKYAKKVLDSFPGNDEEDVQRTIAEAFADRFMNIGTQECALQCSKQGKEPVFMYRFDHFNKNMYGFLGAKFPFVDATHVADITFLFGAFVYAPFEYTEEDLEVIGTMSTLFTNFAKHGDPNGKKDHGIGEKWYPVNKKNPEGHLRIGLTTKMAECFYDGRPLWFIRKKKENKKRFHF